MCKSGAMVYTPIKCSIEVTVLILNYLDAFHKLRTAVAQWLRHCVTDQKVAGSIPDGVMEFFIDVNPSDRTKALGSTQPLTELSTGSISWG
jgi:hypothetical protein